MNRTALAFATLAAAAVTACTSAQSDPEPVAGLSTGRQCLFTSQINGYSDAPGGSNGSDRLYVNTGPNGRWLFETFGACPELDWTFSIALDTRPTSASSLCTGDTATLLVPRSLGGPPDRCTVRLLGKMEPPPR